MALPSMCGVNVHAMYYKIAKEQATKYRVLNDQLNDLQTRSIADKEIGEIQRRIDEQRGQAAVIAITFSGMSLETFFYDYAAHALGDKYVNAHLDRLDLKSKFVVYPQLVCGKAPDKSDKSDKSDKAYRSLYKLVSLRNDLVHVESKVFKREGLHKDANVYAKLQNLAAGVDNAVKCGMLVMDELDTLHGGTELFALRMRWSNGF